MPSTLIVTNLLDSGAGSLRQAILDANAQPGADTIDFASDVRGTIALTSGELDITDSLTIDGPGAGSLAVSGGSFAIGAGVTAVIDGLAVTNGSGIYNSGALTVSNSTLADNSGYGAIYNLGSAVIDYSTLSGNTSVDFSGAIYNYGTMTVNNSTLSGNTAFGGTGYQFDGGFSYPATNGLGGGIYMDGGTLAINSSTLADNAAYGGAGYDTAVGDGYGGALYIAGGTVSINNSTLADNQAVGGVYYPDSGAALYAGTGYGGGIYNAAGADALQIHDTILAGNTADVAPDLDGVLTSLGHNLIGNTSGGSGFATSDLLNVNPQLGPLQDNGGPTQTMALLFGSPAINAGDNTGAPAYDQRGPGFARVVGGAIDIGALEVQNLAGLTVSGFPSVSTAGTAGSFTVTVINPDGTTDTGYTGTVHFTCSDSQAVLPADYTFTAADAGVHTFSAILKTAGTQAIAATDTATNTVTGTDGGITVNPAAASKLCVAGFPSPTTAGAAGNFTVTLKDTYGNIASGYSGTVHFSSSDARAVLPGNYTFTASDAGTHTFSATLKTAGTQSITAQDTTTASLTSTDGGITVNPAAASKFILTAPASITAGTSFSLTLTVQDAYGNVVTNYTGTVHFSSTDTRATLPANYTFTATDKGVHTFSGLVLRKRGNQKITITDTQNSSLTGSVIVNVL